MEAERSRAGFGLVFWGLSRAFDGTPRRWAGASIGVICAMLVLALRALAGR